MSNKMSLSLSQLRILVVCESETRCRKEKRILSGSATHLTVHRLTEALELFERKVVMISGSGEMVNLPPEGISLVLIPLNSLIVMNLYKEIGNELGSEGFEDVFIALSPDWMNQEKWVGDQLRLERLPVAAIGTNKTVTMFNLEYKVRLVAVRCLSCQDILEVSF